MVFVQRIMGRLRDSHTFAFVQGFWERYRLGDAFGRSHQDDAAWDEAYDSGANLCDRLMPRRWGA